MKSIRSIIGSFFLTIASIILPKDKIATEKKTKTNLDSSSGLKEKQLEQPKPIRFTDVRSYYEQLKEPIDGSSAYISITHSLISVAKKRNTPIRINISATSRFDKTGEIESTQYCNLSEYNNGSWRKLKELAISINSIVPLIDEMIDAMGHNGWGCMIDSREQLHRYLLECIDRNRSHAMDRCKSLDISASLNINVFLIIDVCEETAKKNRPRPSILAKVSIETERDSPVESAQFIYFTRKPSVVEKPTTY